MNPLKSREVKNINRIPLKKGNHSAQLLGLFFGFAALVFLLSAILSPNRLGTMDNGRYEPVMLSTGLEYLENDLQESDTLHFDHVIERYGYGTLHAWKLLAPNGECSILYPITLIRLLTQPFGLQFSTQYLAILYALLFSVGTYVLVRASGYLAGWAAALPGCLLTLAAASPNLAACFNSLYPTGTVIVGLLLMAAMALRLFTYGRGKIWGSLALFLAAAGFGLNASALCIAFAPFVAVVAAAGLLLAVRDGRKSGMAIGIVLVALVAVISSSAQYHRESADIQSDASAYNSAFAGFLETSDTPQEDLAFFDLDESYLADVGKTYYLDASAYVHAPQEEQQGTALFKKLNRETVGTWYLRHPLRLLQTADRQQEGYNHFEFDMALQVGLKNGSENRVWRAWSLADTLLKLTLPERFGGLLLLFALTLPAGLWTLWRLRRERGAAFSLLAATACWSFGMAAACYVPLHLRYMGRDFLSSSRIVGIFSLLLCIGGVTVAAADAVSTLSVWFRAKQEQISGRQALDEWRLTPQPRERKLSMLERGGQFLRMIAFDRKKTALAVLLLAFGMSAVVQLSPLRAGCVNNGDFGRMMEQLGLTWRPETLAVGTTDHWIVEQYDYLGSFDWTALTPLNPKYSLIYPAALVRLLCNVLHQPFNTWYLSMLMNTVVIACIVSIVYNIHNLLGRYALLLGVGLCGVFLSENYLVWLNSLFGESCMLLGLLMVLACCVRLAMRPARSSWVTVLLLIFSSRILICAKAQMLTAVPFVLLLILVLGIYQRPKGWLKVLPYAVAVLIGCVLICSDCVRVYHNNAAINEHNNVWQATFYGVLVAADDPDAAMEELGIDERMKGNIGTNAYEVEERYSVGPNDPEAQEMLYDHVNTFTLLGYYLRHPKLLLEMLDYTAKISRPLYNGFRTYQGMDYAEDQNRVQRWSLWMYWRQMFTCGSFLGYVVVYGITVALWLFGVFLKKERDMRWKLLGAIYIGVMLIGAAQYPLPVIGNGFADNHKQLFGFMMCHDILTLFNLTLGLRYLRRHGRELLSRALASRRPMREQVHM